MKRKQPTRAGQAAAIFQAFFLGIAVGACLLALYFVKSGVVNEGVFVVLFWGVVPILFFVACLPPLCLQIHNGVTKIRNQTKKDAEQIGAR
jgi:hypothetical protein